jgi:hypothetical protein
MTPSRRHHTYSISEQRMARHDLNLLGDGVDGVEDAGEVAEEGEQEADPELMLQVQEKP